MTVFAASRRNQSRGQLSARALRGGLALVVVVMLGWLSAASQARIVTDPATHKRFGISAIAGAGAARPHSAHPESRTQSTGCATDCSPLRYSGGPVQHGERAYLFFWDPAGQLPPAYETGLSQWLQDIAVGGRTNSSPLGVTQQYYDNSGSGGAQNSVRLAIENGGAIVDTNPYPSGGCAMAGYPVCVTDAQIQAELGSYIAAHNLPTGDGVDYFVLTPSGVSSCLDSNPADGCSYTAYCAYHNFFSLPGGTVVYADLPWIYGFAGCDSGPPYANSNQIDSVVDAFSHEFSESITDPELNGWSDSGGNEIADKCVALYGDTSVAPDGGSYNVQLGGDYYLIQTEFSNSTDSCELSAPVPDVLAPPGVSGQALEGATLLADSGSWSGNPTGFSYQWQDCDSHGQACSAIPGATGQSYQLSAGDVGHTVRVAEMAVNSLGASDPAFSDPTGVVLPLPPSSISGPVISGLARAGQTLSLAHGAWAHGPTSLLDRWERCDPTGLACAPIPGAGGQTYTLTAADIGHSIRVQEIASNLSGSGTAVSAPTPRVGPTADELRKLLVGVLTNHWRAQLGRLLKAGRASYSFRSPSPGRLTIVIRHAGLVVARGSQTFPGAKTSGVLVRLTAQGRKVISRRARLGQVQLVFTFTPAGGAPTSLSRSFKL